MSIPIPYRLRFESHDGRLSIAFVVQGVSAVHIDGLADGAKTLDCWAPDRRGIVRFEHQGEREMSGPECAAALALLDRIAEMARGLFGIDNLKESDDA